jgi:hypothetical protein
MSTELLTTIQSRGYWEIVIRPMQFKKERIGRLQDCWDIVRRNRIELRGWDFPHLADEPIYHEDNVESQTAWMHMKEQWRLYQSGQFVYIGSFYEDWVLESPWFGGQVRLEPGKGLDVLDALYRITEFYRFTARLAQQGLFDDRVFVRTRLSGVKDRLLIFWPNTPRFLRGNYFCAKSEIDTEEEYASTDMVARTSEFAFKRFEWLCYQFGLDDAAGLFQGDQDSFLRGQVR